MPKTTRTIHQVINQYALINAATNEWIYEGSTYGSCINMLDTLEPGTEFVIVAVMREGTTKRKKGNEQKQVEKGNP